MKKDFLAGVVALGDENPKRFAKVIRNGWPEIKAAMDEGHTLKVIHQRLAERGVRISYRHFTRSVRQLLATPRTARDESGKAVPKITTPARAEKRNDSGHDDVVMEVAAAESPGNPEAPTDDPWGNLRKLLHENRPGFQWDEEVPDTNKLY